MRLNFLDRGFGVYRGPAMLLPLAFAAAGASIAGGVMQHQAAGEEAKLQQEQGELALREAQTNADMEAYNQTQAVQRQRIAFLANGVTLEGSPTKVLEASKSYGQLQVNAILNQGAARYNLAQRQASITKNQGRAALIAGVAQGVGTAASGASAAYKAGLFNPPGGMTLSAAPAPTGFVNNGGGGF